ncbi:methyltransferase [Pseudoclavibacter endophyticus]|uniref:16S rRNA (Guanine(966)-N(2))-methyltransferase RsmD n=1 Tax=Pseudoclavibacter endophyticus TaxID=1778590 RepID=A0A6H9WEF4_9MICO|nr:16S rRNA (guanine(966)-N(2))-methyltransferase RsmD [Pseudoclavibacter endophyticus]KAB1649292.1 16S rRNA (guanine(966)-N(2))-methyltransferase RsmD [Pseudoclavibacter endophyticus]GGA63748.1 methyltransferase [Pseudoclavibacter endophyticus]
MTRIIAGDAKGVSLTVPKSGTRPTSDRVREAMFSSLDASGVLDGATVLDLYAGTGALGLEALSRGAAEALFVERGAKAANLLKRNARQVQDAIAARSRRVRTQVVTGSALGFAERDGGRFDVVFADPPYEVADTELEALLAGLAPRLAAGGVIVLERGARSGEPATPAALKRTHARRYGDTALLTYELTV